MSYKIPIQSTTSLNTFNPITSSTTTMVTSFVHLEPRILTDKSSGSDSGSKSQSSSSSKSSKCIDKQRCETGTNITGLTVGLSIGIPVFVFAIIIGFFVWRSYKKGKKESETDNDPDFYGETTMLPDYPNRFNRGNNNGFDEDDGVSFYSNPFANDSARYPSKVLNHPDMLNQNQNRAPSVSTTVRNDPYYESFKLPYQHNTGSHHSLDEFAKEMGSEYPAYHITSRPNSPYRSANSSSINVSTNKNVRNLTEKTYSLEDPTTTDSSQSYRESKFNTENVLGDSPLGKNRESSSTDDDDYKDSYDNLDPNSGADKRQSQHYRQNSELSYIDEPEVLTNSFEQETGAEELPEPKSKEVSPVKKVTVSAPLKDAEEEDEDEDIKRMKSVYRVYFDRENSIKKPNSNVPQSDVPPLPKVDTEQLPEPELKVYENEDEANTSLSSLDPKQNSSSNLLSVAPQQNDESTFAAKHRAVSSIYSTIPLAQFDDQPQPPQQAYYQQNPRYHPQQQQQQPQHIYQPPYPQGQYQQHSQPPSPQLSHQPQFAPPPLEPLQSLPTPNKMDYNSIVTQTDYAPKKSLTTGNKKPDLSIKPFNPLHYSDQIFTPTSPISPPSQQFPQQPQASFNSSSGDRNITPPSPHHIRQSIVMMNPVEIGKQRIYRPAGSFSQMNSANSSRNASLTSQSAYTSQDVYQAPSSAELPRSGSQADLRKQLGASDNYNFV